MTNISRAMTPALNAGKYPALVKHADEARTIFISAITALLLLICAVAQVRAQQYQTTNLVSDVPGLAPVTDPNRESVGADRKFGQSVVGFEQWYWYFDSL